MSLQTDIIFVKALKSNSELMESLPAHDVYNPAIRMPDKDAANASIPYIIVRYDGMQNQDETKDDDFEGGTDMVYICITLCAFSRAGLGEMAETVRSTIRDYFRAHRGDDSDADFELIPDSMELTASDVRYDPEKPCVWQELTYICDTEP